MATPLVVLFEDDPQDGPKIANAIASALKKGIRFSRADDKRAKGTGTYEDRLYSQLQARQYAGLALIVTDRDLSRSVRYPGLSEAVVSKVASRLGVPVCVYAAGQEDSVLERQRSGGDSRIILDSKNKKDLGRSVAVIASGFLRMTEGLYSPDISRLRKKANGPSTVVAAMLGRLEIAEHLSLYASGDQKMIAELMPIKGAKNEASLKKRIPTILGYWLVDSVLRFPGLLVNEVAAASYLNIDVKMFHKDPRIRKLLSSAIYDGPFADPENPQWWRDKLDDLLQKKKVIDGRELVEKAFSKKIKPCLCDVDNKSRAGYYCVVSRKPVSKENSRGQISWLPRGADLSRVRNDIYDELAPWIGLS